MTWDAWRMPLTLYAFVGMIMLIGIVKKNAIMMIDFALNRQRNDGVPAEKASPPTTATPSGRRVEAPAPQPIAIGSAPMSAAIVVIMIGRKRTLAAFTIASSGVL